MKTMDDGTGNSEKDWEIFDVLCRNMDKVCGVVNCESINNPPNNPHSYPALHEIHEIYYQNSIRSHINYLVCLHRF